LRQQGGVRRDENPSKISHRQVQGSFHGADFCSGEQNRAANTDVFARDFSKRGRKSAHENQCGFDSRHLKEMEI
jgi:hypothetical protein